MVEVERPNSKWTGLRRCRLKIPDGCGWPLRRSCLGKVARLRGGKKRLFVRSWGRFQLFVNVNERGDAEETVTQKAKPDAQLYHHADGRVVCEQIQQQIRRVLVQRERADAGLTLDNR